LKHLDNDNPQYRKAFTDTLKEVIRPINLNAESVFCDRLKAILYKNEKGEYEGELIGFIDQWRHMIDAEDVLTDDLVSLEDVSEDGEVVGYPYPSSGESKDEYWAIQTYLSAGAYIKG